MWRTIIIKCNIATQTARMYWQSVKRNSRMPNIRSNSKNLGWVFGVLSRTDEFFIISVWAVATIRLWTEAIEGSLSGVSNYIPAIVSVWGRTDAAKPLHAYTLSGLVWPHSDESGCQKSHSWQHIFIIQLQYNRRWHLYGWSQGNISHAYSYETYETHAIRFDLNFN